MNGWLWQSKPWQAFKNFAIVFSFFVNLILLIVLFIAAPLLLPLVSGVARPLVGGLNDSFVEMGEARIVRTIEVNDQIPIDFELPLATTTTVRLVQPVPLSVNARFVLPAGGGTINGTVFLELPAGLNLPVQLDLTVPVSQTIPVTLAVDVDIPLEETELGPPFGKLQALFGPLDRFLSGLPDSNEDLFNRVQGSIAPAGSDASQAAHD